MIAHLTVPRLSTRLAIGIENALAHAVVNRLLGFDRAFAESRLQLTPVEWGIWTFLILRALDGLDSAAAADRPPAPDEGRSLGPGDLRLDRAGPDPFDPTGLGAIVTVRWGVRIGTVAGSVRLGSRRSWCGNGPTRPTAPSGALPSDGETDTTGRTVASRRAVECLAGRGRDGRDAAGPEAAAGRRRAAAVRVSRLTGTPASPAGPVDLVLDLDGPAGRFRIPARPVADSGGRLVRVEDGPRREPRPRDPILVPVKENRTMSQPTAPTGRPRPPRRPPRSTCPSR